MNNYDQKLNASSDCSKRRFSIIRAMLEEPFVLGVQSALVPIRALVLPGPRSVGAFDAPQRTRGSLAELAVPGGERVVRVVRPILLEQPQGRRVAVLREGDRREDLLPRLLRLLLLSNLQDRPIWTRQM